MTRRSVKTLCNPVETMSIRQANDIILAMESIARNKLKKGLQKSGVAFLTSKI
jgi:hypothetical protein